MEAHVFVTIFAYLFMPSLLFYNAKRIDSHSAEVDFLSRDNTNILKGAASIFIVIHHFSQRISSYVPLMPMVLSGYLWVGIFLFFSGYGLTLSFNKKNKIFLRYFPKRFIQLILPLAFVNVCIWLLSNTLLNTDFSIGEILLKTLTLQATNPEVNDSYWYVKVIFLLYILFYITFKFIYDKKMKIVVIFLMVSLCAIIMFVLKFENYWINGVFCFPFGVYAGLYKDKVVSLIKKYFLPLLFGTLLLFGLTYTFPVIFIKNDLLRLIFQIIAVNSFILFLLTFFSKVTLKSSIFKWLSGISFEIYIIHLPILYILEKYYGFLSGRSFLIILIVSITLGLLVNRLSNGTINLIESIKQTEKAEHKANYTTKERR